MFIKKEIFAVLALVLVLSGCSDTGSKDRHDGGTSSGDVSSGDSNAKSGEDNTSNLPGKRAVVEVAPSNWYIRLVAEDPARDMKTASTQLGELEEDDTVTKHTLKSLTPFGGTYLDVVFKDPAGVERGEYKVNFHKYEEGAEDKWHFTVKTDEHNVNADILLSWRGVYVLKPYTDDQNRQRYSEFRSVTNPIIKQMKLVDTVTGDEIPAAINGKVQTYAFNMNGEQTRTFEWVVQTDEVVLPVKRSKMRSLHAKALKKDAKVQYRKIQETKAERFDLTKPPMIKEDSVGR